MRTYEEMVPDFAGLGVVGKEKWINNLVLDEMLNFRSGLNNMLGLHTIRNNPYGHDSSQEWLGYWISYIDGVISDRIEEIRVEKLKELGI